MFGREGETKGHRFPGHLKAGTCENKLITIFDYLVIIHYTLLKLYTYRNHPMHHRVPAECADHMTLGPQSERRSRYK